MFAWLKRLHAASAEKAETLAREAATSTITFFSNIEAALGGLPRGLLDDPFVVGLVSMYAGLVVRIRSDGTAPMHVVEAAMIKTVQGIFASEGCDRLLAIGALRKFKDAPECAAGHRAAELIFGASLKPKQYESEPEVQAAKSKLAQMSLAERTAMFGSIESDQVVGVLTQTLVLDRLASRPEQQR